MASSRSGVEPKPVFARERTTLTRKPFQGDKETLPKIDAWLHDLSQPMTVLLCLLEVGLALEASTELKQVLVSGVKAAEKLRVTVSKMQAIVQADRERNR